MPVRVVPSQVTRRDAGAKGRFGVRFVFLPGADACRPLNCCAPKAAFLNLSKRDHRARLRCNRSDTEAYVSCLAANEPCFTSSAASRGRPTRPLDRGDGHRNRRYEEQDLQRQWRRHR